MKYLKSFLESTRFKSEDDVTDYLLELIDIGFLIFKKLEFKRIWGPDGNTVIGTDIHYLYSMTKGLKRLKDIGELGKYVDEISQLYKILKRWDIQFTITKFNEEELVIIDKSPEYITDFFIKNGMELAPVEYLKCSGYTSPASTDGHHKVSVGMYINDKLDFFIDIEGKKPNYVEEYISNIVESDKYQLKLTKSSGNSFEYQIIPK